MKIRKKVKYFQPTMSQCEHSYSKRRNMRLKRNFTKPRLKTSRVNIVHVHHLKQVVVRYELQRAWMALLLWLYWLQPTWPLSWADSTYCLWLSSADFPHFSHPRYPGVFTEPLALLPQVHTVPAQEHPAWFPGLPLKSEWKSPWSPRPSLIFFKPEKHHHVDNSNLLLKQTVG